MPSVIGIDGSRLSGVDQTGTETYSTQVIGAIANLDPPENIRLYTRDPIDPSRFPDSWEILNLRARRLWTISRLSREMRRNPATTLFVPAHIVPPVHPTSVVTIHDLAYLKHPELFSRRRRRELDVSTRWSVRAASHVIAVSYRTRNDLIEEMGVPAERITTIHHGVSDRFTPPSRDELERTRARLGLPRGFLLSVGSQHPRKNFSRLIKAFEIARDRGLDHDLVIVGKPDEASASLRRQIDTSRHRRNITLSGYADGSDLPSLYSLATATVIPSIYEGFGMPALESMGCETPVVASGTGALPEICDDAAIYVDPFDERSIASQLLRISADSDLRNDLVRKGHMRARCFKWDDCASRTLSVIRHTGAGS